MNKELVCPFCNKKLEPIGTSGQFQCGTWGCDASFNFIATRDVWEYIERTRKALDVANEKLRHCVNMTVEEFDELKGNLLIAQDALLHFSKDPIANNALKKITKQKDVK